jgi:hypothetical protein
MTVHFSTSDLEFLTSLGINTTAESAGVHVAHPDSTVLWLQEHGVPVTRENYLALNFPGNPPDELLDGELEAEMPRNCDRDGMTTMSNHKGVPQTERWLLRTILIAGLLSLGSFERACNQTLGRRPDFSRSANARLTDAHFVRALKDRAFIIDHQGIRMRAKCTKSVTWLDGDDADPKPLDDHDCTYMYSMIGKSVGDDLMVEANGTLILYPWMGEKTTQTADYLEILDEEPIK